MDDKSVSNGGKLTARCQCFRGSSANLVISVFFTVDIQSTAGWRAGKRIKKKKKKNPVSWWMIRCKCSVKLLVLVGAAAVVHITL